MWDLTVTNDHDFYVDVLSVPVLVHNISGYCRGSTDRNKRRNNGENFPTRDAAEKAAREEAGWGGPRAAYRGVCRAANHVHVDFYNNDAQLICTSHYYFPPGG
jgi:hypothetical protein